MKFDRNGLLLVGAAAAVLLIVVRKSTVAGAPTQAGQAAIGSNAASWLSNAISNIGGNPVMTTGANSLGTTMGGVTLFGNGTFDAAGIYVDPGQLTYNTKTGQVQESPFSGMYNVLAPATYGF
ncbi:hypothetical protein [Burkholderia stagnalis]|uniref:hypothetical protein n=1 Tax=Burkholderia stagnalis TaxID=1503054 RepID=UPI000F585E6C|nr:hypothetical protein [Burkholderia stagnalis]RQQ65544.1 hypothetical protein DF137_22435 [Burkholderia stagnalis]RQQ78178.1 hypothetical protein DF138_21730 [Burkholderia stagnalis]RQQ87781.1 hypothetical protein DF136_21400 [Burkholderia stagnalis]